MKSITELKKKQWQYLNAEYACLLKSDETNTQSGDLILYKCDELFLHISVHV